MMSLQYLCLFGADASAGNRKLPLRRAETIKDQPAGAAVGLKA